MEHSSSAYGLWSLVIINSAVFIIFAFSFTKPKSPRDWRSLGIFSAFVVALFTERYGFPLTIYLLSGWLARYYPQVDFFSHEAGHLWHTLLGMKANAHFDVLHIVSNVLIFGGFWLLAAAWNVLYKAQQEGALAVSGPYRHIRHPQYAAFVIIMLGFLLQWPTLPTLVMFPVLVYVYVRLARREEEEVLREFGKEYEAYRKATPPYIPRFGASMAEGPAR
ncbi:MAG: isoprenylcysteine carboxylmethyltransferase family protein [Gammaproteobacteria bacterium]|nr:isoprenylcysteine carboxylmethyltransferase family protein [Gammaproteobacteria bacterium]